MLPRWDLQERPRGQAHRHSHSTFPHSTSGSQSALSLYLFVLTEKYIELICYSTIGRISQNWLYLRTLADVKLYFDALGKKYPPQKEATESKKIFSYLQERIQHQRMLPYILSGLCVSLGKRTHRKQILYTYLTENKDDSFPIYNMVIWQVSNKTCMIIQWLALYTAVALF